MIKTLFIQNYESHKDTILSFPPGLTVFVGDSDKGKSGTFRAFNWCRTNKPLGDGMFPLFWDGDTKVQVEFYEGDVVTRLKAKNKNEYQLNNNDSVNAGTDVPTDIKQKFNMSDVNYQSQIDRPFLMFETTGERGRILNKIAGLDKIDSTLSAAVSDISRIKTAISIQKSLIDDYEKGIKEYENLPAIEDLLTQAKILDKKIIQTQSILSQIERDSAKKQTIQKQLERLATIPDLLEVLERSKVLFLDVGVKTKKINEVEKLCENKKHLIKTREVLSQLDNLLIKIDQVKLTNQQIQTLQNRITTIQNLIRNSSRIKEQLETISKEITNLEKQIPKKCPTCGTPLK